MKPKTGQTPEANPVLKLAAHLQKTAAVNSYRKGWQQAQRQLDHWNRHA